MKEIRFHGRGGQGAAKGSEMLTMGFVFDDKFAASFPMYGAARKGAAVSAFVRYDEAPVREKTQIYYPDCLMIFDASLMDFPETWDGFKSGGVFILNTDDEMNESPHPNIGRLGIIDANKIAMEELGIPAVNTTILASLAATTGWVGIDSLKRAYGRYFDGGALEKNWKCADRGYNETTIVEFEVKS